MTTRRSASRALRRATGTLLVAVALHEGAPRAAFAQEAPPGALHQDAEERALSVKARGDAAMESGDFAGALNAYRAAYEISPNPALLYNMGSAEERLGMHAEASHHLELFARSAPPELKTRVPHLDELLSTVRAHVAYLTVRTNVASAKISVRGKPFGATPMKAAVATAGGKVSLEIAADGYVPYRRDVVLEEGRSTIVDVTLVPSSSAASGGVFAQAPIKQDPADAASEPITKKWWFWAGMGVAVVGGGVITAALLTEKSPPRGDIPPGQATAPLLRF